MPVTSEEWGLWLLREALVLLAFMLMAHYIFKPMQQGQAEREKLNAEKERGETEVEKLQMTLLTTAFSSQQQVMNEMVTALKNTTTINERSASAFEQNVTILKAIQNQQLMDTHILGEISLDLARRTDGILRRINDTHEGVIKRIDKSDQNVENHLQNMKAGINYLGMQIDSILALSQFLKTEQVSEHEKPNETPPLEQSIKAEKSPEPTENPPSGAESVEVVTK